jgi:hypothetical protein
MGPQGAAGHGSIGGRTSSIFEPTEMRGTLQKPLLAEWLGEKGRLGRGPRT